jgi:hypothetical protein
MKAIHHFASYLKAIVHGVQQSSPKEGKKVQSEDELKQGPVPAVLETCGGGNNESRYIPHQPISCIAY